LTESINSAPCLGVTHIMWLDPDLPAPALRLAETRAKALCARCPDGMFNRCLTQGYTEPYLGGVWAGMTDLDRRKHRRNKTPLQDLLRQEEQEPEA
jgi:hypothetical protein